MENINKKLVYSIPEAAVVLGIGKSLCYRLAKSNQLPVPVIKLGKRLIVSKSALDNFLQAN